MLSKLAEMRQMKEIPTFIGEVVAIQDLGPRMRRITIGGEDMAGFEPIGPDQYIYLLLPPPGKRHLTVDNGLSWTGFRTMPKEQRPIGAYYTVRHHRPTVQELDLDMVLHESNGPGGGHVSEWAARAGVGDPVALWGPRVSYHPPQSTTDVYLFVDETGIPAAACIAESLPPTQRAHLFIETDSPGDVTPVGTDDRVEVRWMYRHGAAPGSTKILEEAARACPCPDPETTYVYGGAESRAMKAIRNHVRRSWQLPRESVDLIPYWRANHG